MTIFSFLFSYLIYVLLTKTKQLISKCCKNKRVNSKDKNSFYFDVHNKKCYFKILKSDLGMFINVFSSIITDLLAEKFVELLYNLYYLWRDYLGRPLTRCQLSFIWILLLLITLCINHDQFHCLFVIISCSVYLYMIFLYNVSKINSKLITLCASYLL